MSQGDQESSQDLPTRTESYLKFIGALGGTAATIWGIILFFIPIGGVDLMDGTYKVLLRKEGTIQWIL